jgi:L-lactate permease
VSDLFNNREIALGIWMVALIVFAACFILKWCEHPLLPYLKLLLPILIPLLLSFIPIALVVWLLAYLNLWDFSVLKETIYWVIAIKILGQFFENESGMVLPTHLQQRVRLESPESLGMMTCILFVLLKKVFL